MKLIRLAVLLLSATYVALCLEPSKTLTQYAHRMWGQEEGLFQPTIYSVVQTQDGFLWLGTQDSLIQFDGANFREFEYRDKAVLHGDLIRTLLQDRNGNLWIGSIGAGLARISPSGEFARIGAKEGLRGTSITNLSQARDGSIWISTEDGLGRMADGSVRMFTQADGLPGNGVRASCESADGARWIAGRDFPLGKWDGHHFTRVLNETVNTLTCAKDGSVWAGGDRGAVRITGEGFRRFTVADGLPDNAVSSLLEGSGGSMWLGTNDGVSRYSAGKFSSYRIRDGLSHSLVLSLAFDKEGSLWVGTKNGLDQLADSPVTPFTTNEGLSSNLTSAVAADEASNLWVGTLDAGLNVFNGEGFKTITQKDGLLDNEVLSLAVDPSGRIWAGTRNGVTRLASGKVSATYPLPGEEVRALFADAFGTIWAATSRGLREFEGNQFRKVELPSAAADGVVALAGGRSVRLFVSLQNDQLVYLQNGQFKTFDFPSGTKPVDCYLVDHERHNAWMGTLGSSLMRWQNGKISRVRVRDGLYDNRIYSILKDDHDNLWMASSKGIFRVGERELNEFADGKRSSVLSIPFTTGQLRFECRAGVQPAACKTKDGRLWFSTTTGLVVIDPDRLSVSNAPPPVRITAFIVDGRRVGFRGNVAVNPGEKNLEIHYTALSFVLPEKVAFQYRLGGFSRGWTDAGSRRAAFFTNLPPGEFHFEVRARSAAGIWSREAAALTFTVEPRLYQHLWFFPALAMLIGGMIAVGYQARVRRLRAGFALVTAERSRIARELHDTLLQGLSGVTMQLHALWLGMTPGSKEKRVLGSIIRDAGQYSAEARQSLWGLRSRDRQASIFSDRLSELARSMNPGSENSVILEISPVSLEDRPEVEFQLLRIAREAIANALNHSGAGHLRVGLSIENQELLLTVTDDGTGFASEGNYQALGHFGLTGMKERAAEIGGAFELESSGRGTRVSVRLPLTRNVPLYKTRQTI